MKTSDGLVYFDYNASTPLDLQVHNTIVKSLMIWGNPSSSYLFGQEAATLIHHARHQVATMLGCESSLQKSHSIIFTSGGTETNTSIINSCIENWSIEAKINQYCKNRVPHVITSSIEHDSIANPLNKLVAEKKIRLTRVSIDHTSGKICIEELISALNCDTRLVTIMLANNETGVIQPIAQISSRLNAVLSKNHSLLPSRNLVIFHTDAAQAIGKILVNIDELGVDALTIVGHKFYGPRIGALYYKKVPVLAYNQFCTLFGGGGQEAGLRSGTENTPMIAGLGEACHLVGQEFNSSDDAQNDCTSQALANMTKYLINKLQQNFEPDAINFNNLTFLPPYQLVSSNDFNNYNNDNMYNDDYGQRFITYYKKNLLPNTLNISFTDERLPGWRILKHCPLLCASTRSACHIIPKECTVGDPSHSVLLASKVLIESGIPMEFARSAIRLTLGRFTKHHDIDLAVQYLKQAVDSILNQQEILT